MLELRQLGQSDLLITPVAMGCWPISGVTSVNVNEQDSLATLQQAYDSGINFFDTAFIYGYEGESETLIARALGEHRESIVIASKCGLHWEAPLKQAKDARPETIRKECDISLQRLQTDYIDLYYLHAPDPNVPLEESAGALKELLDTGKIRAVGVSNFQSIDQYERFQSVCPITASQPYYNMLQRDIEEEQLPWLIENGIAAVVYWPLMKGFLAGRLKRDHQWDPKDGRQKYPVFFGEEWDKTHDFLDKLRPIAKDAGLTIAQLVIAWTIQQPGITAALCGAKRPEQIAETAAAMGRELTTEQMAAIDKAIEERGPVPVKK